MFLCIPKIPALMVRPKYYFSVLQNAIEGPDLGTDAASIQASIEQHQEDHREIQAFRQEIENCKRDFVSILCSSLL